MEQFTTTIALIGIVIVAASLLSGALERTGAPLVVVFLALGAALGPWGLDLVDITLDSGALRSLATLGLALVLFSDAVTIDVKEVRTRWRLALRSLVPGTLVPAFLIALMAVLLLDVSIPAALILGAALASTDPVLLRSVLRSRALPQGARIALRLESGMNDVVLLPIVVLSMLLLGGNALHGPTSNELGRHAIGLFILGPVLGALVGWLGIIALVRIRSGIGVRRDYESLYALGLAFTGYAAAEAVGGSGFLAAFAAGFMVAWQDVELCDCFLEYGEATAEMLLLLTFVAFGTSVIWSGLDVINARVLVFAAGALFIRTLVLYPLLAGVGLSQRERTLVALLGPRGLSSLLFALLPVFAGIPGAEQLFAVVCLVVLLSVVIHGAGSMLLLRGGPKRAAPITLPTIPGNATVAARSAAPPGERDPQEFITLMDVKDRLDRGEPLVIVDARAERSYNAEDLQARGAVRVDPDDPVRSALEQRLSQQGSLVVYCA